MKYDFSSYVQTILVFPFYVWSGVYKFLMNVLRGMQQALQLLSTTDALSKGYWTALFSDCWSTAVLQEENTGFIHENQML